MKETFKHIGDLACFQRQRLYWDTLPLDKEIEVELINFWDAEVVTTQSGGAYMEFAAYFCEPMEEHKVEKGDIIVLHFAYRSMARALDRIPLYKKKWITRDMGEDNVYIKFIKKNDKSTNILELERRKADQDMSNSSRTILNKEKDYPKACAAYGKSKK